MFFLFSSVILSVSLQFGKWNFRVFVFSTYFFLPEDGVAVGRGVALAFGVAVGRGVALAFGVAVGRGDAVGDGETNTLASDAPASVLSAAAASASPVTAIRPASVSG